MARGRRQLAQRMTIEAFGVQLDLMLSEPRLKGLVRQILPPGSKPCSPTGAALSFGLGQTGENVYQVTIGGRIALEHASEDVALGLLDAEMRLQVAIHAKDVVFVHAGVVAIGGSAVLIPGESFSGKSTLVSALVLAGATYYSDEYAVLDSEGMVHPYARPLSIRTENGTGRTRERDVRELGGVAASQSCSVGTVLITRYRPGAEWQPTTRSPGAAVLALLANTVPAQTRRRDSLRAVSRAARGTKVLEGDRGEAAAAASALCEELAVSAR